MSDENVVYIERAILGQILQKPEIVFKVIDYLSAEHFSVIQHSLIYDAIQEIIEEGGDPGFLIVLSKLENRDQLNKIGGKAYLEDLYTEQYPESDLQTLADVLIQDFLIRKANIIGYSLTQLTKADKRNAESLLTQYIQQLEGLIAGKSGSYTEPISTILREEWEALKQKLEVPGISGISTGIPEYDILTSGLVPTDLIIIASRPSVGKTSLILRMMLNIARNNIPCLLFSYEMSRKQLSQRMVAMESGIPLQDIMHGTVKTEEIEKIREIYLDVSNYPIYIDSNMAASLGYVLSTIRRYVRTIGVRVVFIDYLQLMVQDTVNETQELGRITRALKMLAMELDITLVVVSQINRDVESRDNKRPQLADLRQSGRIEEDANIVTMLYRPAVYGKLDNENEYLLELIIRKNRNGPLGIVQTYFDGPTVNIINSLSDLIEQKTK